MNAFQSKYPTFTALLALIGAGAANMAAGGKTFIQKLESEASLLPQLMTFYPQASNLSAEITTLKSSPADIVGALEVLVTDLSFSSDRAKAIIPKAFAVAEWLAQGITPIEELVASVKA